MVTIRTRVVSCVVVDERFVVVVLYVDAVDFEVADVVVGVTVVFPSKVVEVSVEFAKDSVVFS